MKLVGCKWEPGKDIQLTNGVSCSEMKQTIRNTSMDIIKDEVSAETRHGDTSRGLASFFFLFHSGHELQGRVSPRQSFCGSISSP